MNLKIKNYLRELKFSFVLFKHPLGGFWDMKHEKRGSMRASMTVLLFTLITVFLKAKYTGFLFNGEYFKPVYLSLTCLPVLVLFMLWCISNYCLTTLMSGEGSFKDILMASGYALIPYPVLVLPSIVLSRVLVLEEAGFITALEVLALAWVILLFLCGMLEIHQYTMTKTVLTAIFTVIGIFIMLFLGLLIFSLADKMITFTENLISEISLRFK